MKKIVFRSGSLRMGGLERVLVEVLQNMNLKKYHIELIIEDDSGEENVFLKDIPQEIKIYFLKPEKLMRKTEKYRKKKKNLFYKFIYNYMMWYERKIVFKNTLKILNDRGDVDLFIDFDWGATKYIEKLSVKKSVVWIHNSIPKLLGDRDRKIKRFGERLSKYDKIIAICEEMKEEIEKIYPYLKGKVEKVYNPFNFERIEKLGEDTSALTFKQKELLKERYCVAVSRLDTVQKDYETLLRAFQNCENRIGDLKLFIVGEGPDRKEIENMIKKYELQGKVELLGLQKNPYIWMKNAQFFVHSSKYEGLPTVLIEAMILDIPVISSDCPTGPKEILENGNSGILYPVGDYKGLAYSLELLAKEPEKRDNILKKSKIRKFDFHSSKVIEKYEKIIEEI